MKQSWEVKKLREIGIIQTGTTPPTKDKLNYGDYINFVKPAHFNLNGTINVDIEGLSEIGLKKGRLVEKDSILMVCIGATIGKTALVDIPVSCNQQINSFTPNKNLCSKFFYYALNSDTFYKKVLDASSQATIPIINKSKWENLEVSFPKSFEEQKQIVEILDKAFETIEQAKVNIEKNIQNSKELFQSRLTEIFSQKGNGWEEKELRKLAEFRNGLNFNKSSKGETFKIVGVSNFKDNFYVDNDRLEEVTIDGKLKELDFLEDGDIVTVRSNGNPNLIGRCMLLENIEEKISFSGFTIRIRLIDKNIYPLFLNYFLKSSYIKNKLVKSGNGTDIRNLNQQSLSSLVFKYPLKIEEQKKIVSEINRLSEQTKQLEKQYKQKLDNLEELKKSILQKAFSGELIP
ncbi:MAG: restriction endonuclease subunit S [Arcobacter sp.]|uniref:restriction endonuclease subunit S n=1 Tax=Arcobacter sp. TaxID=1872629 RepID=UPI003C749F88